MLALAILTVGALLCCLAIWISSQERRDLHSPPPYNQDSEPTLEAPRRSWRNNATRGQLSYLQLLVNENNHFRATPLLLNDWFGAHSRGRKSFWAAHQLIRKLKSENSAKAQEFKKKLQDGAGRNRKGDGEDTLRASDLNAYGYCPNAFTLRYRGYADRNLYELEQGQLYHGEAPRSNGYAGNKNSDCIRKALSGIRDVTWFKTALQDPLSNQELGLTGIPDGLIEFENGELAVVEVKTAKTLPERPYRGDILQACAYRKLYLGQDSPAQISTRVYILYIDKRFKDRLLFEVDASVHERNLLSTLQEMRSASYRSDLFQSQKKKCQACGFRALCKSVSGKAA